MSEQTSATFALAETGGFGIGSSQGVLAVHNLEAGTAEENNPWALRTQAHLSCARALTREAESQVAQNAAIVIGGRWQTKNASIVIDNGQAESAVIDKLRTKLANTKELTKSLQDQVAKVDEALRKLKASDLQLQRAAADKQAHLCVSKRRLELRAQRPEQELVRDAFQEAIEFEEQALAAARQDLGDHIQATRDHRPGLAAVKQEMLGDCLEKRRSGHIDHLCLLDGGHRPMLTTGECVSAPTLASIMQSEPPLSPGNAGPGTGKVNEEQRKDMTRAIILKSQRLILIAEDQCRKNQAQIAEQNKICQQANKRTVAAMNRSVALKKAQKKQLEEHLEDADRMIFAGQISLERTEKKLKQHEHPLQVLSRQLSMREMRVERENIRDTMHEKLVDHLDAVKQSVHHVSSRVDGTLSVVHELKATRTQLQEALNLKTLALRLDMACTKVALKNAAGHFFAASPRGGFSTYRSQEAVLQENGLAYQDDIPPGRH